MTFHQFCVVITFVEQREERSRSRLRFTHAFNNLNIGLAKARKSGLNFAVCCCFSVVSAHSIIILPVLYSCDKPRSSTKKCGLVLCRVILLPLSYLFFLSTN